MARSVEALVNANMLRWARRSAGFELDTAAKKIGVSPDRLSSWETGASRPTIKQLFTLSNVYKRPANAFYLSEIPSQPTLQYQGDYRRLPGVAEDKQSPNLVFALRRAEYRRNIAIDLHQELDLEIPQLPFLLDINDDIEAAANQVRAFLDVPDEVQMTLWRSPNDALNGWREALERVGTLVFQASRIALSEMRAISISERPLPYILLNSADTPNGRIFSLLHEFVHVVLENGERTDSTKPAETQKVEVFCNAVASAILMPEHLVTQTLSQQKTPDWDNPELIRVSAEALNVSREAFVRRLVTLHYVGEQVYRRMRRQFQEEYRALQEQKKAEKSSGGPSPHVRAVSAAGYLFSQLVLSSLASGKITTKDASDFFEASAKHLPSIERLLERRQATPKERR